MATSKTLTPTNVTIQIPEFTDQPDQRVNSNCIDKEADAINALNNNISTISGDYVKFIKGAHASTGSFTKDLGTNKQWLVAFDRYSVNSSTYGGLYFVDTDTSGPHVFTLNASSAITSISVNSSGVLSYTTGTTYVRINAICIGR